MRVKEQLQELRRLDAEINNKIKELEELRQWSVGVGSFDYSKDRVVSSPSGDAMPNMVSKIIVLDEQINDLIDTLTARRDEAYFNILIPCPKGRTASPKRTRCFPFMIPKPEI